MEPIIVKEKIAPEILKKIVQEGYDTMVKVAVDIEKEILALGGEYHAYGQEALVEHEGSNGQDVWGANFYPFEKGEKRIQYIALINIKPAVGNRKMEIEDSVMRKKVREVIEKLLLSENETFQ